MAAEPTWIAPTAASITILLTVAGIGWRSARNSGQDSITLLNLCKDSEAQKKVVADHEKTLAAHTTLHEQHAGDIDALQNRMLDVERSNSELKGRIDASHGRPR